VCERVEERKTPPTVLIKKIKEKDIFFSFKSDRPRNNRINSFTVLYIKGY
jgi:hypothetical protein